MSWLCQTNMGILSKVLDISEDQFFISNVSNNTYLVGRKTEWIQFVESM